MPGDLSSLIAIGISIVTLFFGAFSLHQKADDRSLTVLQQTFQTRIAMLEREIDNLREELDRIRILEAKCQEDMLKLMHEHVDAMRVLYKISHPEV